MPTESERRDSIVNNLVLPILGVFSQLQVWDERAKVQDTDTGVLVTTYHNWIDSFTEEVYRNDHQKLDPASYTVDKVPGTITFTDPTILTGSDFFITYKFNYYSGVDLGAFVDMGLGLINSSAEPDTHLTEYTLDVAPTYWDSVMALYVYQRALETMVMDSLIWKNYLIFQDGAAAQGLMEAEITRTKEMFDDLRKSVKRKHYVTRPTQAYEVFRTSGIGMFTNFSSRLRGFQSNRIGIPNQF